MHRWLRVVLTVLLVGAACGGSSELTELTEVAGENLDTEVSVAVAALVEDHGIEGAFAVGVFALERGYSARQVIDAATGDGIQRDGMIDSLDPDGEALGLILIDPNSVLFASVRQPDQEPIPVEEFRDRASGWAELSPAAVRGDRILRAILERLRNGACGELTVDGRKVEVGCTPLVLITAIYLGIDVFEASDLLAGVSDEDPDPGDNGQPQTEEPTISVTRPTDELVALFDDSLGTQGNCVQRPDHDAISCAFTFSLKMNYRSSALPREVVCFFPDIDSSTIFPIYDEPFPLDSLEGVVPFEAHATAWYDSSSNPQFSNPVAIECQLSEPAGDGSTRRLDIAEFSFDLPGAVEPSHCVPAGHSGCTVSE